METKKNNEQGLRVNQQMSTSHFKHQVTRQNYEHWTLKEDKPNSHCPNNKTTQIHILRRPQNSITKQALEWNPHAGQKKKRPANDIVKEFARGGVEVNPNVMERGQESSSWQNQMKAIVKALSQKWRGRNKTNRKVFTCIETSSFTHKMRPKLGAYGF
jgi:hypothetical protein